MDVAALVGQLQGVDVGSAQVPALRSALSDVARVQSWLDGLKVTINRRLREVAAVSPSMSPEHEMAAASRSSQRDAERVTERSTVLDKVPDLELRLHQGDVSGEHVDALSRAAKQLDPGDRDQLFDRHGARLAALAAQLSPEQFAKAVKVAAKDVTADDGLGLFERQRRATALRSWVDRETGMVHINGQFDPETGLRLLGRLHNTVQALFAEAVPDTCPRDPERKQNHLRALALIALTDDTASASPGTRTGTGAGRAEMIVVIDERTLRNGVHEHSIIDVGADVDVPVETLRRLACDAHLYPAVLGTNGVILDLGRSARLADANQWRALRATYPTCMIDGCTVPYQYCELHHIDYWRNGGPTDHHNLGPLCNRHHHLAHEGGWTLDLHPTTRTLTITYPDGSTDVSHPPRATAA